MQDAGARLGLVVADDGEAAQWGGNLGGGVHAFGLATRGVGD